MNIVVMFLLKYYKIVLAFLLMVTLVIFVQIYAQNEYKQGQIDATAKISAEVAEKAKNDADKVKAASLAYQEAKKEIEKDRDIKYVEIQKIIENPIYNSDCFDDAGLHVINSAISGNSKANP